MTSRLQKGDAESGERPSVKSAPSSVAHISDARRGAVVRAASASFDQQLEETRELLDRGLPSAAEARLRHIISSAKRDRAALARARRLLSVTLEMLGRYRDSLEGHYERALENFEQAIQLVGDRPAAALLGRIYNNIAGAYWFLKRPHDGIRALEKAVTYYETTEHKDNAATGFNNLGINLMLIGEWDR